MTSLQCSMEWIDSELSRLIHGFIPWWIHNKRALLGVSETYEEVSNLRKYFAVVCPRSLRMALCPFSTVDLNHQEVKHFLSADFCLSLASEYQIQLLGIHSKNPQIEITFYLLNCLLKYLATQKNSIPT